MNRLAVVRSAIAKQTQKLKVEISCTLWQIDLQQSARKGHYQSKVFVCVSNNCADAVDRLLIESAAGSIGPQTVVWKLTSSASLTSKGWSSGKNYRQRRLRMCQGVWAIFCHNWLITLLFHNHKANCLCKWQSTTLRPFHTAKNRCAATCIRAAVTPNRSLFGKPPGTSLKWHPFGVRRSFLKLHEGSRKYHENRKPKIIMLVSLPW